jgi:hypothetical protein
VLFTALMATVVQMEVGIATGYGLDDRGSELESW